MPQTNSLQGPPDLRSLPPLGKAEWPSALRNAAKDQDTQPERFQKLENHFAKSVTNGYFQSHPYDQMHLSADMMLDQLANSNTYMKLIFGGEPSPYDNIDLAYNHSIRQMSESLVEGGDKNPPDAFVPVGECGKDDILRTFEEQRRFYKGVVDTDVERALKQRPTHNLIATTFYGKKGSPTESARYNNVRGQNDLQFVNIDPSFRPNENLSSRTYAPMENGGFVPLDFNGAYGDDARAVPLTNEPRMPAAFSDDYTDLGNYAGFEPSASYVTAMSHVPGQQGAFVGLFHQNKQRM
jgi:hypothetical protein